VANGMLALVTVARGVFNGMLVRSQLHLRSQEHEQEGRRQGPGGAESSAKGLHQSAKLK